MCKACDALVIGVPDVRSHDALRSIGTPSRSNVHAWVVDFRCDDCRSLWHYLLDEDHRIGGFQRGAAVR